MLSIKIKLTCRILMWNHLLFKPKIVGNEIKFIQTNKYTVKIIKPKYLYSKMLNQTINKHCIDQYIKCFHASNTEGQH